MSPSTLDSPSFLYLARCLGVNEGSKELPQLGSSPRQTLGAPFGLLSLTLQLNKAGPHTGFFCSWLPWQMLGLFKVEKNACSFDLSSHV